MLGGLALDVYGLIRQVRTGGVDALAACLEHCGDGMLGQPVDLKVGPQAAQLVGDGDVTLSMTKPDG